MVCWVRKCQYRKHSAGFRATTGRCATCEALTGVSSAGAVGTPSGNKTSQRDGLSAERAVHTHPPTPRFDRIGQFSVRRSRTDRVTPCPVTGVDLMNAHLTTTDVPRAVGRGFDRDERLAASGPTKTTHGSHSELYCGTSSRAHIRRGGRSSVTPRSSLASLTPASARNQTVHIVLG